MYFLINSLEILLYTDNGMGAANNCVSMTMASLKTTLSSTAQLSSNYTVRTTNSTELVGSKWKDSAALLVMPGGRDLPYCKELNGKGNEQIRSFVEGGGSYLGICAGAYYGSAEVEFSKGDPNMEVIGPRELAFFPVTARGPAFPGYAYDSNAGQHAAEMTLATTNQQTSDSTLNTLSVFYNGGCKFVPFCDDRKKNTPYDVLMRYTGYSVSHLPDTPPLKSQSSPPAASLQSSPSLLPTHAPPPSLSDAPAAVGGAVGRGKVILTGVHIEATPEHVKEHYGETDEYVAAILPKLSQYESLRGQLFTRYILYLLNHLPTPL